MSKMRREEYQEAKRLFHELDGQPVEEVRRRLSQDGWSEAFQEQVLGLLGFEAQGSVFADEHIGKLAVELGAVPDILPTSTELPVPWAPPQYVGGFQIGELLGRGGMGVVYRGTQAHPKRDVAIKVLQALGVDDTTKRRFEYEADILARLDHPFIARVLEAGVDPGLELPYIAMELVSGPTLLEYQESEGLSRTQTLEIFECVCQGVEHAHQNGIVHRDLKPANILVSEDGRPRLLDFGIARPTHHGSVSTPGRTQQGSIVGSLAWMSPEQAQGDLDRIDVRTDVYSLGVILYRMLSGRMPYDLEGLAPWEAASKVQHEEPQRLGQADRQLRGDLEAIAAMALEKDPRRRYPSAGALGRDVRRFLNSQPVEAQPWSALYQLRKFSRRHRLLVGASASFLLVLLSALISGLVLWQKAEVARRSADAEALRAREEAESNQRIVTFMQNMFDEARVLAQDGAEVTVKQVLDTAVPKMEAELDEDPLVKAQLQSTIGHVYASLGLYTQAQPLILASLDTFQQTYPENHHTQLMAHLLLGQIAWGQGKFDDALPILEDLLPRMRQEWGLDDQRTLKATGIFASLLIDRDEASRAEPLLLQAIDRARAVAPHSPILYDLMSAITVQYLNQGRREDAERFATETYEGRKALLGPDDPMVLASANSLASLHKELRRYDQALPLARETYEGMSRRLGEDHPFTLTVKRNLANLYSSMRDYGQAEPMFREVVEDMDRVLGTIHSDTLRAQGALAEMYVKQRKLDKGLAIFESVLEAQVETLGENHTDVVETLLSMARLETPRDPMLGEILYRDAYERALAGSGFSDLGTCKAVSGLMQSLLKRRRRDEAAELLGEALQACEEARGPNDSHTLQFLEDRVRERNQSGKLEEARELVETLLQRTAKDSPDWAKRVALRDRLLGS